MSQRSLTAPRQTFLVEHYRPGFAATELEQAAARVRKAVHELRREGQPVAFRHSTVIASDESFLCVLDAPSEYLVRLAYARASVSFERISPAVTEEL